jgi:type VI secretion system VasD/TssJ family lipoprotein
LKKFIRAVGVAVCILFFISCAAKKPPPPEWPPGPEEITMELRNDGQLNLVDGMPHTLLLCVYQLNNQNSFNQLSADLEGLRTLLECNLFDGSVASSKKIIAYPGQNQTFVLDRAEGAKYVAVVAGYYQLEKERVVRMFDIPTVIEKKGIIKRTVTHKAAPLSLVIHLGSMQLHMVEGN